MTVVYEPVDWESYDRAWAEFEKAFQKWKPGIFSYTLPPMPPDPRHFERQLRPIAEADLYPIYRRPDDLQPGVMVAADLGMEST